MQATINECATEFGSDALHDVNHLPGEAGVGNMIKMQRSVVHVLILPPACSVASCRVASTPLRDLAGGLYRPWLKSVSVARTVTADPGEDGRHVVTERNLV